MGKITHFPTRPARDIDVGPYVLAFNDLLRDARETLDPRSQEVLLWMFHRRIHGEHRILLGEEPT
jgi:hypothetical protein